MSIDHLDLVCFSHLRWNFVFQRPQHLLSRFAKRTRVFYIEEAIIGDHSNFISVTNPDENIWICVPHINSSLSEQEALKVQQSLLLDLFNQKQIEHFIFWFYTPMFFPLSMAFNAELIVYDCMDELSAFKFAPKALHENEAALFGKADLVFTGGKSLFEAKKHRHAEIYSFPSSIDKEHFQKARLKLSDPDDQQKIPFPRFGFYGVIDERMNLEFIREVALTKPQWNFVFIGPVVKIDSASLPKLPNIHFLGGKSYQDLPSYLSGWNIAMIPFELNESTRFISPTKTPEYLSAGKPVISSSIHDVVDPYGNNRLVHIADTPQDFIRAAEDQLVNSDQSKWLSEVDAFLLDNSWDNTWSKMVQLMEAKLEIKAQESINHNQNLKERIYV